MDIKLVCFDLDRTLIKENSWYDLNLALGITHEEDTAMYDDYMAGKFTYPEWTKKLLELFKHNPKANEKDITEILSRYTLVDGAREAVSYLKEKGYHVALISGSLDVLVDLVARDLGIELAEATNEFVFDESGKLVDIISPGDDKHIKLHHLESFARRLGLELSQCACIGDGDNDIEMFRATGKGITFKGSKIESEAWKVVESLKSLKSIL